MSGETKKPAGGAQAKVKGNYGERLVASAMEDRGWTILERNFHSRFGEIDLIARGAEYIVFVEVKLRKSRRFAEAREFVTRDKQRKLKATAEWYLSTHPSRLQPRFDVAEVYAPDGAKTEQPDIRYYQNAF